MIRVTLVRALVLSAAFAGSLTPVRCLGENAYRLPAQAAKELSPELLSLLQQKNMPKHSPILVRIFKEESELEVWKQDTIGHFQFLKIYPICRWSGDLGPKIHEGDRQAPEGFYTITSELMNANSNYYLAINTGFPNTFDKANGRDGSFLMIHGDCASSGCYAMTDEQIGEIYSLARDSLLGGKPSFQIQAHPFRLTPANLARHRTNPHMPFWKMLKIGNDHFETTHLEPKVEVCDRRYVFDAQHLPNSSKPLVFDPNGKCPAFVVNPQIALSAGEKQQADEVEYAQLVKANVPVAPIYSGLDGGMNKAFLAEFPGKIIPLARVLTTGSRLPQMPPVAWADNDGSLASKLFGALFRLKPAPKEQIASTNSPTQEPGVDSPTAGLTATPTAKPTLQMEAVAAANPMSRESWMNEPGKNEAPNNEAPVSKPQQTAALQSRPAPQQEANVAPATASDNIGSAPPKVSATSFDYRWGGLQ
ncbi:MAG: murein L,D-transpeptidase family protein [Xanthobacteraceae bacterium]